MDKETEVLNTEVQITPGQLLKEKRESLGLSIEQVASRLRLRVIIVQSLEADNFNIDKVTTFTRGYVRSYAKLVGIDEEVILSAFDLCSDHTDPEVFDLKSFSRKTSKEQHNSRINILTVCIIFIVLGISSVWWYQNQQQDSLKPSSSMFEDSVNAVESGSIKPYPKSKETTEKENSHDVVTPKKSTLKGNQESPLSGYDTVTKENGDSSHKQDSKIQSNITTETTKLVNHNEQLTVNTQATSHASYPQLVMMFNEDCWIQVKDATGKTLAIGLKKSGHRFHLEGKLPLSVILGAPENVSITFAGEPIDLSRYTSGKVARFTLP